MCVLKILQTISTLHILTAFYITETKIGIIFIVFSLLFKFFCKISRYSNRAVTYSNIVVRKCDRILENLPFGHIYLVVQKQLYLLVERSGMSQTLQKESLKIALSKCALKIGIEKYLKTLICFVLK